MSSDACHFELSKLRLLFSALRQTQNPSMQLRRNSRSIADSIRMDHSTWPALASELKLHHCRAHDLWAFVVTRPAGHARKPHKSDLISRRINRSTYEYLGKENSREYTWLTTHSKGAALDYSCIGVFDSDCEGTAHESIGSRGAGVRDATYKGIRGEFGTHAAKTSAHRRTGWCSCRLPGQP